MREIRNGTLCLSDGTAIEFHVPSNGGHIRLWTKSGPGPQVCEGLYLRGPTLWATPDNIDNVVRREWRRRVAECGAEAAEEQIREDMAIYA